MGTDLRARMAVAEATSSELRERQRALRQRLAVTEAELLRLAGPEDARGLGWFKPAVDAVPAAPLPWLRR